MLDLSGLNAEQRRAVLATRGPVLVLAGAGSGKTRVITYRLARLIDEGVNPQAILSVTFTNKAAFEMRDRARKLVGLQVRAATISTFHALGVRMLKLYPALVGLRPGFTITDAKEQLGSLRRILRQLRIDDRRFDPTKIAQVISAAKNAGLDAEAFQKAGGELPDQAQALQLKDPALEIDYQLAAMEAYQSYETELRAQNVVDFDDLLLLTLRLLQTRPEVLSRFQDRWRYLQIDEYQDTNGAQFALMRLLAGQKQNLCVVGDDDQSIYGWRGADVKHILRFGEQFPSAQIIKLETNYRSTGNILEVANRMIERNPERYDKRLKPAAGAGPKVKIVALEDEEEEAEQVASTIQSLLFRRRQPKDIAVLFRSNVQARPIELALRSLSIPYRVVGGMDLFDKKEMKDAIAYLKYLNNPDDEQSLRRIINYPPRGIGDTTIVRIDDWARERGLHLSEALRRAAEVPAVTARAKAAIDALLDLFDEHRKLLKRQRPSTVARKLLDATGLEAALMGSSDSATTTARRVDNVREVVRQIERYEARGRRERRRDEEEQRQIDIDLDDDLLGSDAPSLGGFLSDLALLGASEESKPDEKDERVVLSTIHAAKGLEWPEVFLVGMEEELLPHRRSIEGDGSLPEECRLAYVAVTRAQNQLTLSYAKTRTRYGQLLSRTPSRFLEGLPEEAVVREGEIAMEQSPEEAKAQEMAWREETRRLLSS